MTLADYYANLSSNCFRVKKSLKHEVRGQPALYLFPIQTIVIAAILVLFLQGIRQFSAKMLTL